MPSQTVFSQWRIVLKFGVGGTRTLDYSIRELRPGRGRSPTCRGEVQHNNILGFEILFVFFEVAELQEMQFTELFRDFARFSHYLKKPPLFSELSPISMATESRVFS